MPAPTYSLSTNGIKSEKNISYKNLSTELISRATSASTITLTIDSPGLQVFTGSVAGQIVNLGDATNYNNGHEWILLNASTVSISVVLSNGTAFLTIPASTTYRVICTSNATANGTWLSTQTRLAGSTNATLVAIFAQTANSVNSGFLDTENIAASNTLPAVAPISGIITLFTFTGAGATPTGTIEIRINATTGTPAAAIVLGGTPTQVTPITVPITAGDRIYCSVLNGNNISKPLVKLYL